MSTNSRDRSALSRTPGPGAFLLRGLAAGLVGGLLAFVVAFAFGEPYVDDAIALEDAAAASHHDASASEETAEAGVEISREDQKSWGLLTGTVAIGLALGGVTALAAAAVVGRLGDLSARAATALTATIGFVAIALVPFLKYPATPPAVGEGETIGGRTASYFALLLVSVLAAIAMVVVAQRLRARFDGWTATFLATGGYVVIVVAATALLPTVDELGDFPADTLWYFRRSSLLVLGALWAAIGVTLTVLIGRLHDRARADAERRALAASL